MFRQSLSLIFALISILLSINVNAQYTVESLPNPKAFGETHYVSNPNGILQAATVAELDAIGATIEKSSGSEFAIVVVKDYRGSDDFRFALDLFNHWGIGKQGADNGLLLFLALDRREYRFISGYGVEGIFPDVLLKRIGETYLVPYLKAGDPDLAVLSTAKAIESVFLSPSHQLELTSLKAYEPTFWNRYGDVLSTAGLVLGLFAVAILWMSFTRKLILKKRSIQGIPYPGNSFWLTFLTFILLMFLSLFGFIALGILEQAYQFKNLPYFVPVFSSLWLSFHYMACISILNGSTKDKKTALDLRVSFTLWNVFVLLLAPLSYAAFVGVVKNRKMARLRATAPDLPGEWVRLDRDAITKPQLKKYLPQPQQREEKLESKSYEIWVNQKNSLAHLTGFTGEQSKKFSVCPHCQAQTFRAPEIHVIKEATYSAGGTAERRQTCASCGHTQPLGTVALAMLTKSSSGSGGSGGRSGRRGRSSSSSSFGGGSSGGGGSGGKW